MSEFGSRLQFWRSAGYVLPLIPVAIVELLCDLGVLSEFYVPAPHRILISLFDLTLSGELLAQYQATFSRIVLGYFLAILLAIPLGVAMGAFRTMFDLFDLIVELFRPVPSIALIPPLILIVGLGTPLIVIVIAWGCFFPILLNTVHGVRAIDPTLIDTGRIYRLSRAVLIRKIVVPAVLPYAETGLRIGLGYALVLVVLMEMLVGQNGIGNFLLVTRGAMRQADMYAAVVTLGIVGYFLNYVFVKMSDYSFSWHRGLMQRS